MGWLSDTWDKIDREVSNFWNDNKYSIYEGALAYGTGGQSLAVTKGGLAARDDEGVLSRLGVNQFFGGGGTQGMGQPPADYGGQPEIQMPTMYGPPVNYGATGTERIVTIPQANNPNPQPYFFTGGATGGGGGGGGGMMSLLLLAAVGILVYFLSRSKS